MKAVYIEAHGGSEVLTYGDRPEPQVRAGEVKIWTSTPGTAAGDWNGNFPRP